MSKNFSQYLSHLILILGLLLMIIPIWLTFASSTHDNSTIFSEGMQMGLGNHFIENYYRVLNIKSGFFDGISVSSMFINSFIMAFGIATLTVLTSIMTAYAIVYFKFKFAVPIFWIFFLTLLVPLELRIMPSYEVVHNLGLLDSYAGLILPLSASAIAAFFFRQFFKSIPDELLEAAKLDGANSWKFFIDFIIPLSKTMMAAMFIFMFVYGYNQYLWPIIITTDEQYWTVVMGVKLIFRSWGVDRFAYVILTMIPPVVIVIFLQRWFIQGLFQTK